MFVPEGENYGGVTDRHAVFSFSARAKVLSLLPWLAEHDEPRKLYSVEGALQAYYKAENLTVRPFARTMALMGQGDEH